MLSLPFFKKNLGAPLQSRKEMLETLFRHLDMVRLSAGAMLAIAAVGCTGLIGGGSSGTSQQQDDAAKLWKDSASQVLLTNCGGCHQGQRPGEAFLGAPGDDLDTVRSAIIAFMPPVVNFTAPGSSRILSKGPHDGPELTADQATTLLQWLQAEQEAAENDPNHPITILSTGSFTPMLCPAGTASTACPVNHLSLANLSGVGSMIPGAEIDFVAQDVAGLYLNNITVVGGTAGVHLEHWLFASLPATPAGQKTAPQPIPDAVDRYFAEKDNVAPNMTAPVANNESAFFEEFAAADPIEIQFSAASVYVPDTGGSQAQGGCHQVASFQTNAVPQLKANCASCHTGTANPSAKASMDLTGYDTASATDPATITACAQVLGQVLLTNPDSSGIYLEPDPAKKSAHPFNFNNVETAFTTFKTAMDVWVNAEKTTAQ